VSMEHWLRGSQVSKRDLGHPSRFSDTARSGDHVRAEAQFPFSSLWPFFLGLSGSIAVG
jgi:hypothetical protein